MNNTVNVFYADNSFWELFPAVRSSIEALLKRIEKNNPVQSVNPLVDIYNSASLRFGLPCGTEDSDMFEGDVRLGISEGGDEFFLIGKDENSPTLKGELCYKDAKGAICRCFNWGDGKKTMITTHTKNAFVIIEYPDEKREKDIRAALTMTAEYTQNYLGAQTSISVLTKENPTITL